MEPNVDSENPNWPWELEQYRQYIERIASEAIDSEYNEELGLAKHIREEINNSEWYDYPYKVLQYSDANISSPAYTPSWQTLTKDNSSMTWEEATEEVVYICLFNDIMKEVKEYES